MKLALPILVPFDRDRGGTYSCLSPDIIGMVSRARFINFTLYNN